MSIFESVRRFFGVQAAITNSKDLEDVLIAQAGISRSGVNVTPQVAMMVSAVSAVTSLLSEIPASLPFPVYRMRPDGGKDQDKKHWAWDLLNRRPNGFQNAFEFREMMQLHLLLWGNCYAFINRYRSGPRRGEVSELIPIHPDRVKVEQDDSYVVTYRINLPDSSQLILPQSRIFHLRDRSLNGYAGESRLKWGRDTIGLSRVAEAWGAQLFGNAARPSGVLSTDQNISDEKMELLRKSWKAAHGGENALATAVLDGGLKWTPLVMNNQDAQFIELRKFQVSEVARIYRTPPHMIGDLERATFGNIEHQGLDFVRYALMPWLKRWEYGVNTQILPMDGEHFAKHTVDALLRGDTQSRYAAHASALQNKWMNANEVREIEDMNPIAGGDVYENPAITVNDGDQGDEPAQPTQN